MILSESYFFLTFSMSTSPNNPWFASTIGLAGLIVGYVLASGVGGISMPTLPSGGTTGGGAASAAAAPTPAPSNDTPADADNDPFIGKADAPITLVEFTDYQCPFCARHFTNTYGQIKTNYVDTGKVKYVTRDYPLGFHKHAQKASEAAECATKQGKFAEMHDKLFSTQATWSPLADVIPTLKQYAKELKLNTSQFDTCLDSGEMASEVSADQADGAASGIDGTPGFWILGPDGQNQKISGAFPYATFQAAFDNMLK